jgi:hypothetical protein
LALKRKDLGLVLPGVANFDHLLGIENVNIRRVHAGKLHEHFVDLQGVGRSLDKQVRQNKDG